MNSLDLIGSKIHAIYLVELKMTWWHDDMMQCTRCKDECKEPNNSHNETRKPWKASEAPVLGRYNTRTHHYTMVFQVVSIVKLFHIILSDCQTHNSDILPLDQIIGIRSSCYDDSQLHSKIAWTFQTYHTYASLSKHAHIYSIHRWRWENNDTHREPQHSSDHIHQYVWFPTNLLLAPLFQRTAF